VDEAPVQLAPSAPLTVNTAPVAPASTILNCGQIATQGPAPVSPDPGDAGSCFYAADQACVQATLTVQFNVTGAGGLHYYAVDPADGCVVQDEALPTTDSNVTGSPQYGSCASLGLTELGTPAEPTQLQTSSCTGEPPVPIPLA